MVNVIDEWRGMEVCVFVLSDDLFIAVSVCGKVVNL